MHYCFRDINKQDAKDISTWQYKDEYCIYSLEQSDEELIELTSGSYYAVDDENDCLVGYFCIGKSAQVPNNYDVYDDTSYLDIGLGLRPSLCGKGNGLEFFKAGLFYISKKMNVKKFRLTVANFNKRAITVYERAGFLYKTSFFKKPSGIEFNVMIKKEE